MDHPNILLILADDLGYGDIAFYNPESKVPTPNIDRLATEGMLFTDAHSPATVCTPSRYSILTGRMASVSWKGLSWKDKSRTARRLHFRVRLRGW